MPAPVALFVYNRPEHTRKVLRALIKNKLFDESEIFIFSDGPKIDDDNIKISEVRKIIKSHNLKNVNVIEHSSNLGLSKSIVQGVNKIINDYGEIIVIEDDILVSQFFLANLNNALTTYKDEEKVIAISGYTFPHTEILPEFFFITFPAVWGWATWKRRWDLFQSDSNSLLNTLNMNNLLDKHDHKKSFPYKRMLEDNAKGIIDSWGIRWYSSGVVAEKYTMMFNESQVENIGHDNSGYHSANTEVHKVSLSDKSYKIDLVGISENELVNRQLKNYLHKVLYDSYLNLADVCDERLELINKLTKIADERLKIIDSKK